MRFSSVASAVVLNVLSGLALAQVPGGRLIDEGTFIISRPGAPPETENFKISRGESGLIIATGQLAAGNERVTSSLTADSLGTPVEYRLSVFDNRVKTLDVRAAARGGRLSSLSSDQHGNESMKEYPIAPAECLILEDELPHQTYFVALARHSGRVQVINLRGGRLASFPLAAHGLEPVKVADQTITATHYSLGGGPNRRDFWVDASGRVLRVEIPARGIVAIRDEPPR